MSIKNLHDLIGKRFGKLLVIERGEDYISPKGKHYTRWLCKCDCGNIKLIHVNQLTSGATISCGCYKASRESKYIHYNKYNLSESYGIGYTSKSEEFYFDHEDYDKIKDYCWSINSCGYVVTKFNSDLILMHRLILGVLDELEVDHINGKRNNNRRNNIRICTNDDNALNHKIFSSNSSGYIGVQWRKERNRWMAIITYRGKVKKLGCFKNIEDAVEARKQAEIKYFGKYSREYGQISDEGKK